MKKIFYVTFLSLSIAQISAQDISKEIKTMFKSDDTTNFNAIIKKEEINKCYNIEESSYSFLALSIKMNKPRIFKKLITDKADINLICDEKTPLMYAAKYGNKEFVEYLLKNGADKTIKNRKRYTAHDYAIKYNQPEIAKILE